MIAEINAMDCAKSGFGSMPKIVPIHGITPCRESKVVLTVAQGIASSNKHLSLLLHQRNKLFNRGITLPVLALNVHKQQLMRTPHLNRASTNALNVVRHGENGQRLVGVEVEIVHSATVTQVTQNQVLLRPLLLITLHTHTHRHQVEQVDLPRLRADRHILRSARTEVHAHHGGIHLQRDDRRWL